MRLLIDIGHPSFVHLFKHSAKKLAENGHDVLFSCRTKDHTVELLDRLNLKYRVVGQNYKSKPGKIKGLFVNTMRLLRVVIGFKPQLILSGASPYASLISGLWRIKHFVFDDTENKEQTLFYKFGADLILTPQSFRVDLGKKHRRYPGIHELAYLPGHTTLDQVKRERPLVFMRFVAWNATHDIFRKGFTTAQKIELVNQFLNVADVVISSEPELPEALQPFEYKGERELVHDLLAQASLCFGESATMAAEAACLNVPAIYFDPVGRGYTDELEQSYNLVHRFNFSAESVGQALKKAHECLEGTLVQGKYQTFLEEHINVTNFIIWLVDNSNKIDLLRTLGSKTFYSKFKTGD